jgi:hypothetical protein
MPALHCTLNDRACTIRAINHNSCAEAVPEPASSCAPQGGGGGAVHRVPREEAGHRHQLRPSPVLDLRTHGPCVPAVQSPDHNSAAAVPVGQVFFTRMSPNLLGCVLWIFRCIIVVLLLRRKWCQLYHGVDVGDAGVRAVEYDYDVAMALFNRW